MITLRPEFLIFLISLGLGFFLVLSLSMSFPPALARQQALAANRFVRPEDSISNVSSQSWARVDEAPGDDLPPDDLPLPTIPETKGTDHGPWKPSWVKAELQNAGEQQAIAVAGPIPPPPPTSQIPQGPSSSNAAPATGPATQAAQNLLAGVNEQFGSRKLRKQLERAQRKGAQRSLRFGQMGGHHNALNSSLPPYLRQVGSGENERSILVVDSRDQRLASPFQGWLVDEILLNAQAGINILSDAKLVRSPSSGYHLNIFYMRTLDGKKLIIVGSMSSYGSVPCGKWDSMTGSILSHKAFQPFRWPVMRDDSPTWVDIKIKIEGALLIHLELRGYRSDDDMTVQLNYVNDALIMDLEEVLFIPACTVTVFQGWRVCAISFEVGGQIYVASDGGHVVALDFPLCHFELRVTATSSADSIGLDADRLEFRFKSAADRLDVKCSTLAVPSTWLVVSRVSGPTLIKNSHWCRDHYARIEGPDQTMQLSQLASIHAHWTASVAAKSLNETGPRIGAVDVSSHPENLHLTCESPLFRTEKKIVPKEAMALQYHDPETERATMIVPPIGDASTVQVAAKATEAMRSLTAAGPASGLVPSDAFKAEVSLTTPGVAPVLRKEGSCAVLAPRRSLEQRQGEAIAQAAVTPEPFCRQVNELLVRYPTPRTTVHEMEPERQSSSQGPIAGPVVFEPPKPEQE